MNTSQSDLVKHHRSTSNINLSQKINSQLQSHLSYSPINQVSYKDYLILLNKNQLLAQEVQQWRSRYENLEKQQHIWRQIQQQINQVQKKKRSIDCDQGYLNRQLQKSNISQTQYLRQQLVSLINQKRTIQNQLIQMEEKVKDLKQRNLQLKNLNEKITALHSREIQMLNEKYSINSSMRKQEKQLLKEKEQLELKLNKCKDIVKEMQTYYKGQIEQLNQVCEKVHTENSKLRQYLHHLENEKKQNDQELLRMQMVTGLTPNSSFSSSIKDSLTKRQIGSMPVGMKTPNKYGNKGRKMNGDLF